MWSADPSAMQWRLDQVARAADESAAMVLSAAARVRWSSPAARRCEVDVEELARRMTAAATACRSAAAQLALDGVAPSLGGLSGRGGPSGRGGR